MAKLTNLLDGGYDPTPEQSRVNIDRIATAAMGELAKNSYFMSTEEYAELLKEMHDRISCSIGYIAIGRDADESQPAEDMPLIEEVN